jgi:hypothetical protein
MSVCFATQLFQSSWVFAVRHSRSEALARLNLSFRSFAIRWRVLATAVAALPHLREQ